jgi:hypothetical protein
MRHNGDSGGYLTDREVRWDQFSYITDDWGVVVVILVLLKGVMDLFRSDDLIDMLGRSVTLL